MFSGQATCCNKFGISFSHTRCLPLVAASFQGSQSFHRILCIQLGGKKGESAKKAPLLLIPWATGDAHHFCFHSIDLHSSWSHPDGSGPGKCGSPGRTGSGLVEHMALSLTHGYANTHTWIHRESLK